MKVLHLNYNDINGGAARAAFRLHESLTSEGMESCLLVVNSDSEKSNVVCIGPVKKFIIESFNFVTKKFTPFVSNEVSEQVSYNLASPSISKIINALQPDVVNLHWIGAGMISFNDLSKIKAPIVWTMHDMWPFTVGKHYVPDFAYYNDEQLKRESKGDLFARLTLYQRRKFYTLKKCTLVSPSQWLAHEAAQSNLTRHQKIKVIQNTIDHNRYFPQEKEKSIEILNLKKDKITFSFGAVLSEDDPRKGFHYLKKAIKNLSNEDKSKIQLVVFGSKRKEEDTLYGVDVRYLGSVKEDNKLRLIYNASDYFIAPSVQDNLPNTVVESLACGTPVIAFKIGGMTDLIINDCNGLLAENVDDRSLQLCLEKAIESKFCKFKIHNDSKKKRDVTEISQKYIELYKEISD